MVGESKRGGRVKAAGSSFGDAGCELEAAGSPYCEAGCECEAAGAFFEAAGLTTMGLIFVPCKHI